MWIIKYTTPWIAKLSFLPPAFLMGDEQKLGKTDDMSLAGPRIITHAGSAGLFSDKSSWGVGASINATQ